MPDLEGKIKEFQKLDSKVSKAIADGDVAAFRSAAKAKKELEGTALFDDDDIRRLYDTGQFDDALREHAQKLQISISGEFPCYWIGPFSLTILPTQFSAKFHNKVIKSVLPNVILEKSKLMLQKVQNEQLPTTIFGFALLGVYRTELSSKGSLSLPVRLIQIRERLQHLHYSVDQFDYDLYRFVEGMPEEFRSLGTEFAAGREGIVLSVNGSRQIFETVSFTKLKR